MNKKPKYHVAANKANQIIKDLGIKNPPVNPINIAEELGLEVYQIEMPESFKSVSGFMDFNSNQIVVNKKLKSKQKAFAVAHEIGHFVLHSHIFKKDNSKYVIQFLSDDLDSSNPYEREANIFAINLLAPDNLLKEFKDIPVRLKSKLFRLPISTLNRRKKRFG